MNDYTRFFSQAATTMKGSAIRQMGAVLAGARDIISFAPGYPAEDMFPWESFRVIAQDLLSGTDGSVLQYGPTRGFMPLREALAAILHRRGLAADASKVLVTTGSQQGLELVARVLLDPGDVVLLERPSYTGAITAFRNTGASLVDLPQDDEGLVPEALDEMMQRIRADGRRAKLLYLVPNFQNPTGRLMARGRRLALLERARRHDLLIVEDDPYGDLYFDDVTNPADTRPIAADDGEGTVIYLSSFSKTLAPGLRVAWMAAAEPIASKVELAKQADDLCTGGLDQRLAYEACRRGILDAHVPHLRAHYRTKRDAMTSALHRLAPGRATWPAPRGGFFLWLQLRPPLDAQTLLTVAREHGVIYVTGSAFFVDGGGREFVRLSFSAPPPDRIEEGIARLAAAMAACDETAAATSSSPARRA